MAESSHAHLLREKWLLVPSYRVGQQWLDAVARGGQPVVNVRLKTLPALALELAGLSLAHDGLRPLPPLNRLVIIGRLLQEQRERASASSYLGSLPVSLALIQQMATTLRDLRLAGLGPEDLDHGQYEAAQKRRELIGLLAAYEDALRRRRLADEADILRRATFKGDALVLVPEDLELTALERASLDAIPRHQRIDLPVDSPTEQRVNEVFRAVGEINEVREVLRRCLANGRPLDQVELLSTDLDLYGGLVYEVTAALHREDAVTFADGIPVRYTRPARALTAWLAWRRADFPQLALVAMMQDGLLDLPEHLPATRLAGILRTVPIGFGRERYLSKLDEFIDGLSRQLADADEERRPILTHRLEIARALRPVVERLLQATCDPLLASAATFLRDHAHSTTELDNTARQVLMEQIYGMTVLLEADGAAINEAEWLERLLRETRVLGLGPRPGCLHVASVWSGGHSGRPHTFIMGLDSGRFPPAGGQDPVLLDEERRSLSAHLATAGQRREQVVERFARLLARMRGRVTLSYSCHDLADDSETFPSHFVLQQLANETELPPACAFAPTREAGSLNETEWWLWRLCVAAMKVREPMTLVGECFPRLGQGLRAAEQRASEAFTAYDGFVAEAGPDLDPAGSPGRLFSPHRLETLGTCPLRYFYQYALGLELPDELKIDPQRWLPPAEVGQLLHEVFHRFLRDGGKLADILQERIEHYREKFPPPSEGVFRRDCRRLERAGRIFLAEEEELKSRPVDFEREISGVPVRLPDGTTIHVRGRLDRVDEMAGKLALWDYKTGSTYRFRSKDPFDGGRVLQHALYITLAEAHYGRPVAQFGYFFPAEKGRGERIVFTPAQLADAPNVLTRLRQLIAHGAFPATNKVTDCEYCDYRAVCGDIETITVHSANKLASPVNNVLQPFRELRPR